MSPSTPTAGNYVMLNCMLCVFVLHAANKRSRTQLPDMPLTFAGKPIAVGSLVTLSCSSVKVRVWISKRGWVIGNAAKRMTCSPWTITIYPCFGGTCILKYSARWGFMRLQHLSRTGFVRRMPFSLLLLMLDRTKCARA